MEDRTLQTEGTARGEGHEQERPLVQLRNHESPGLCVDYRGGGRVGRGEESLRTFKGILGSSQEQMESTREFEQGVFIAGKSQTRCSNNGPNA